MRHLNARLTAEIRNRAAEFEHAMIGAGAQIHLLHGSAHQLFAGLLQLTEFLHFGYPISPLTRILAL